jgi:hypothetical protein
MTLHVGDEKRAEEMLAGYQVASGEVVRQVAERSPTVVETLHEARQAISRYFGADVPVRLSVDPDPEIAGYAPVTVEILTPRGMEDGGERLKRFDDEWWMEAAMKEATEVIIMTMPQ